MSYQDVDGVQYWIDDRQVPDLGDPYKVAAETLARDVERYLYRQYNVDGGESDTWMRPEFLAWAVARYDACKTGSGHYHNTQDYDPESATLKDFETPPAGRHYTDAIRYPEAARQAEHIDTGDAEAGARLDDNGAPVVEEPTPKRRSTSKSKDDG